MQAEVFGTWHAVQLQAENNRNKMSKLDVSHGLERIKVTRARFGH